MHKNYRAFLSRTLSAPIGTLRVTIAPWFLCFLWPNGFLVSLCLGAPGNGLSFQGILCVLGAKKMGQNLDELFDVVDEQDRVIGQATRREVHARGLRHRAVHLLVVNGAGRVFLQKRSMQKDIFPGAWDSSAAGHVGAGEDYDGTAVRELAEELGLKLPEQAANSGVGAPRPQMQRMFRIESCVETGREFVWVYRVAAEGPFTLQTEEIECGDWFAPMEIDRWLAERPGDFASAFPLVWRRGREMIALWPTLGAG